MSGQVPDHCFYPCRLRDEKVGHSCAQRFHFYAFPTVCVAKENVYRALQAFKHWKIFILGVMVLPIARIAKLRKLSSWDAKRRPLRTVADRAAPSLLILVLTKQPATETYVPPIGGQVRQLQVKLANYKQAYSST
jgi:hypothetical protein